MLPHKRRVSTLLFKEIMDSGSTYHTAHISLRIMKTAHTMSRFSVVVPKKVEKTAVGRNKMKRRLYSSLSKTIPTLPLYAYGIFFIKKGFSVLSYREITAESKQLLQKALHISLN